MEKVFDHVQWSLFTILDQLGFNPKFTSWIRVCIVDPYIVLLINGSPSQWLQISRDLHQGHPLSIYLSCTLKSYQSFSNFVVASNQLRVMTLEPTGMS